MVGVERALKAQHDPKYLQMFVFLTDGFVGNEDEILRVVKRGAWSSPVLCVWDWIKRESFSDRWNWKTGRRSISYRFISG